jgi:hypothetical protein
MVLLARIKEQGDVDCSVLVATDEYLALRDEHWLFTFYDNGEFRHTTRLGDEHKSLFKGFLQG